MWSLLQRLFDSVAKCFFPGAGFLWKTLFRSLLHFHWTTDSSNFNNNNMGITMSALKELRSYLSFTQLRFHCSKKQGRTFHVTTVSNSTGAAMVQFFSGQKDMLPDSCGYFQRMENGNSKFFMECESWNY